MSNEEKMIAMLEALTEEVRLLKTEQEATKRLLNEHNDTLKKIKEVVLEQEKLREKLEYFEKKYQGMGA